jgi:Mn-dependent DtxR family transcriptional regulator
MPRSPPRPPRTAREALYRFVPTDTRYHIMRLAGRGGKEFTTLKRELRYAHPALYGPSTRDVQREVGHLETHGMVKTEGKTVRLTPFGEKIFGATSDFLGRVPAKTEIAAKTRVREKTRRLGALTNLFSGQLARKSLKPLLDMADEHERTGKQWLDRPEKPIFSRRTLRLPSVSNLVRQGLIKLEAPVRFLKPVRGRGQAVSWKAGALISEIPPRVRKQFAKVPVERASLPVQLKKRCSARDRQRLAQFLETHGVDKQSAEKIRDPYELTTLGLLARKPHNITEIRRFAGADHYTITKAIRRLQSRGLISQRRRPRIQVTLGRQSTRRAIKYLRTLEKLVNEEAWKNPAFRAKLASSMPVMAPKKAESLTLFAKAPSMVEQHPDWNSIGPASRAKLKKFEERVRANWQAGRVTDAPDFDVYMPGRKRVAAHTFLERCMPHVQHGMIRTLKASHIPFHSSLKGIASTITRSAHGRGPRWIVQQINKGRQVVPHTRPYFMPPEAVPEVFDPLSVRTLVDIWKLKQDRLNDVTKNPSHISSALEQGRKAQR